MINQPAIHPVADLFPLMTYEDLRGLAEDIPARKKIGRLSNSPEDPEAMADFDKNWRSHKLSEAGLQAANSRKSVDIKCVRCNGTGAIDAPYSGSDPSCPDCDGEGIIYGDPAHQPNRPARTRR